MREIFSKEKYAVSLFDWRDLARKKNQDSFIYLLNITVSPNPPIPSTFLSNEYPKLLDLAAAVSSSAQA